MNDKTTQLTYRSAIDMAVSLKDLGYPGITMLDIALGPPGAAFPSVDREVFFIQGNGIIIPQPYTAPNDSRQSYNTDKRFSINFNGDGSDSEDWIGFDTFVVPDVKPLREVKDVFFFKFTVRDDGSGLQPPETVQPIRIYIVQNPFWMQQINLLVKDIVR